MTWATLFLHATSWRKSWTVQWKGRLLVTITFWHLFTIYLSSPKIQNNDGGTYVGLPLWVLRPDWSVEKVSVVVVVFVVVVTWLSLNWIEIHSGEYSVLSWQSSKGLQYRPRHVPYSFGSCIFSARNHHVPRTHRVCQGGGHTKPGDFYGWWKGFSACSWRPSCSVRCRFISASARRSTSQQHTQSVVQEWASGTQWTIEPPQGSKHHWGSTRGRVYGGQHVRTFWHFQRNAWRDWEGTWATKFVFKCLNVVFDLTWQWILLHTYLVGVAFCILISKT